jgi:tRNA A37 N6-isopentenylltransferase MiaA
VPREVLHRRLAARVDQMLAAGLVAEVRRHLDAGVAADAAGLDGIGYREVVAMLNGQLAETALRDSILVSTRRYAKRQDTWFRNQLRHQPSAVSHQPKVWVLDATRSPEQLASEIMDRWKQMAEG